jgi:uncharacterized membrane protein
VEPLDPYAPPEAKSETLKPLGSLAQSARGKEISHARNALLLIGFLTMGVNAFLLYNLPNEIEQAIRQAPGANPADIEEFKKTTTMFGYLIYGGTVGLGLLFVIFGLIVNKYPLPITIISLVLYILANVFFMVLNPASITGGIVIKAIIVLALFRAIKAARAYNAETRKAGFAEGEMFA